MKIAIVTPAAARSRNGNRNTAARWARFLREQGHRVTVEQTWGNSPADFWATGYGGAIVHYDGSEWATLDRYFAGGTYAICGNLREALVLSNYGIISYHR